jgi:prepilin-type N-terminal cleavage/methylation domain-containing protein
MMRRQNAGFTLTELMAVVAILSILTAIAVPNFNRMQARARQAEANTNLKSLFTGLRTIQRKPPLVIRAGGVAPERGNRYSYHLEDFCNSFEERSTLTAVSHNSDTCIGVDTLQYPSAPQIFAPVQPASVTWSDRAASQGMGLSSGIYGTAERWDFLMYAAGDVDNEPDQAMDTADTWLISSADGMVAAVCPSSSEEPVAAGEPFNVSNDVTCD